MSSKTLEELSNEVKDFSSIFSELNAIDVNGHTEEKNGLTYLSWAWAWSELKKKYPTATYTIERFGEDKKPYLFDELLGYMVFTSITIDDLTHSMWLPVMDGANKAMKDKPYKYTVKNPLFKYAKKNQNDGKYYDKYGNIQEEFIVKVCDQATMFDINKTIMRCLVKNISMFGLGLYIYAGEDLPEQIEKEEPKQEPKQEKGQVQTTFESANVIQKIEQLEKELVSLGSDLKNEKTIEFIKKRNNGKNEPSQMDDRELYNYSRLLEEMIKMKKGDKQ